MQISAAPLAEGAGPMTEDDLAADAREYGQELLETSVQDRIELARISGPESLALVYHLTDRDPESGPGDYRELHQGFALVGPALLVFSLLTHTADAASVDAGLNLIRGARFVWAPARRVGDAVLLGTTTSPWGLRLDGAGWQYDEAQSKPAPPDWYFLLNDDGRALNFSVRFAAADHCTSARACLELGWSRPAPFERTQVRDSQEGEFEVRWFVIRQPMGAQGDFLNLLAHAVRDGIWIDVHVSTVGATPEREQALRSLVRGLAFEPRRRRPPSAGP